MSASDWTLIIGGVFLGLGQLVQMILSYMRDQAKAERDAIAAKQLKEVKVLGRETHALVDGSMTVQLRLNAAVAKRLAEMTGQKDDAEVAALAQKTLIDHEATLARSEDNARIKAEAEAAAVLSKLKDV